jgi:chromosomal replication initiator protein
VEDQVEEIWRHVDDTLRGSLPPDVYRTWIEPLVLVGAQGGVLYLRAPASTREWIRRRFGALLDAAIIANTAVSRIELIAGDAPPHPVSSHLALKPGYTFEAFVIGSANRFAHAASLAVAELPAQVYNPLFICGPSGIGKTHLLQAIGNYVSLCVSGLTVRYANAETFTSEFLAALQHNQIPSFKQRYRSADVLLLDDVQFLESKERTSEEFLYTIEAALTAGAQVVLSADRPPAAMPLLHAPLKGRFEGGLLVELTPPDQATRLAILRRQAGPDAEELTASGVLDLLARRVAGSVRSLESALVRARAYASLTQQPLTLELAEHVVGAMAPRPSDGSPSSLSIEHIQDRTSLALQLEPETLTSARRSRQVVYARQVAMYLCRELTDHSLPAIARRFGGRDHTTVLHAHRKVQRQLLVDQPTRDLVDGLVRQLKDA